ncbi:hypothetical protein [Streptomyces sp. N35]|uniref:hypothetical protein n=1 Tax=Streptomyces sp. N35 TaxID=2795730 RepID=UPI0018F31F8F|nr:hypothetical protein [Streptomyces sp. N35]
MSPSRRAVPLSAAAVLALALIVALLQVGRADAAPVSAAAGRLADLASDAREADGYVYGLTDDTGRTMDAAEIRQAEDGTYLAVYHTVLDEGPLPPAASAPPHPRRRGPPPPPAPFPTSTDLVHWTRRHDFGPGTHQATLAKDPAGGWILAFERDPRNHIAIRGYAGLDALLAGDARRSFDAPLTLSRCAEGTPAITAIRGDTVELTGHYRSGCDIDRQLRATLTDFTTWHAEPDPALDTALRSWGSGGNIGDRSPVTLDGRDLVVIEGQRLRDDFASWRTYIYDPRRGRADLLTLRTHGASTAFANPSVSLLTSPSGRPALLISAFIPQEGAADGEAGQMLFWRSLKG